VIIVLGVVAVLLFVGAIYAALVAGGRDDRRSGRP